MKQGDTARLWVASGVFEKCFQSGSRSVLQKVWFAAIRGQKYSFWNGCMM